MLAATVRPDSAGLHLLVDNLACVRGGRLLFEGLSFAIASGDALAVRGPNGCGKSSLLRVLAGFLEPEAGTVMCERDGDPAPLHYVGHADPLKLGLTTRENLAFTAQILGGDAVEAGLAAFDMVRLKDVPARQLSAGQRRRLSLGRLIAAPRAIWLLDEPGVGLDAASREKLENAIAAHRAGGGIVVAATHGDVALPSAHVLEMQP